MKSRSRIAGLLLVSGLLLAAAGCGIFESDEKEVDLQIMVWHGLEGKEVEITVDSQVVVATTVPEIAAVGVPPVEVVQRTYGGRIEMRITAESFEPLTVRINTRKVRSISFDYNKQTGRIIYMTGKAFYFEG